MNFVRSAHLPKVTVLSITARNLYLREQATALREQTFQDFEWIVVDEKCDEHRGAMDDIVASGFPLLHIPDPEIKDYLAPGAAQNHGLIHSRGELIYFMGDHVLPLRDCLERHWDIYQSFNKNVFISGRCARVNFLPSEMGEKGGSFKGEDYRMGLFTQQLFRSDLLEEGLREAYRDGAQNWWAGKNDSAPLEAILECNGIDETFDGGWGYHDDDLANRMMTLGLRYLIDLKSCVIEFPHESGGKKHIRSDKDQIAFKQTIIERKARDGIYTANPNRNLRKEREECLRRLALP